MKLKYAQHGMWLLPLGCSLLALQGCGQETRKAANPAAAQVRSSSGMESDDDERTTKKSMRQVEPGTELAEASFEQTLRNTGARFIIIQVYMESCGPCMTEALRLEEHLEELRKSGVAVLGLGMDDTPDGPKAFFRHTGERITYPLYMAPWFSEKHEVFATPTLFIYRGDGKQLFRADAETAKVGVREAIDTKLTQLLEEG